jgi:hypothetical protein
MTAIATFAIATSLLSLTAVASDALIELNRRVRQPRRAKLLG